MNRLCLIFVCLFYCVWASSQRQLENIPNLIAHGGGEIMENTTTNAFEAINHSLGQYKYIELDLVLTSDSFLVAAHDWELFNSLTDHSEWGDSVLTLNEFEQRRILGKYKPVTYLDIQNFLRNYPDWVLVTDKLDDPLVLERFFADFKDRIIVEAFSIERYNALKSAGFLPMLSDGLVDCDFIQFSIENMIEGGESVDFITSYYDVDYDLIRRLRCLVPFKLGVYSSNEEEFVEEHLGYDVDFIYTDILKP